MKTVVKPNFFVVGAPKSGTTSLYFYLKKHPQVYLPRIKELNFFCNDLHFNFPLLSVEQFADYYSDYNGEVATGEVSVWNLYSKNAAANIYQYQPEAKIIIMLRNPVDMIYALHSNHVFNNNEIITDFEEALNAQEDRKLGLRISKVIKCPVEGLYYFDIGEYYEQVKRYTDVFGSDRVKIILYDEFAADTRQVYTSVVEFIGVDHSFIPEFEVYNANKTTRSDWLKRMTIAAPSFLKSAGKLLFPHQSKRRDYLMYWLWKMNTRRLKRTEMNPALRKQLTERFKPGIHQLEALLKRDLSLWLR
jgi:hypothetical protein